MTDSHHLNRKVATVLDVNEQVNAPVIGKRAVDLISEHGDSARNQQFSRSAQGQLCRSRWRFQVWRFTGLFNIHHGNNCRVPVSGPKRIVRIV